MPEVADPRRPMLTSAEVARMFKIGRATLYRWLKDEKIPEPWVDPDTGTRTWRQCDIDALSQYVAERQRQRANL